MIHSPTRLKTMSLQVPILALALLLIPSVVFAFTSDEVVTPASISRAHHPLAVSVVRHGDNTLTFTVSMVCNEGDLAMLCSHIADASTTFAHSSCSVSPLNGMATARVTVPEKLLATSALSFSHVRSRPDGEGKYVLMSGSHNYFISLSNFASQAEEESPAPKAPAPHSFDPPVIRTCTPNGRQSSEVNVKVIGD